MESATTVNRFASVRYLDRLHRTKDLANKASHATLCFACIRPIAMDS